MKTSSTMLENFQAEIVVTIPPDEIESRYKQNLQDAIKDIDIPGFRKGKAPKNVLERHIDEEKLWEITINDIIEDTLPKALEENKLKAARTLNVAKDKYEPGAEFTYRVKIELMPIIPDYQYRDIPVKIHKQKLTDEIIEATIDNLRLRLAKSTPIKDRPAIKGDWAAIEIEGYEFSRIKLPGQSDEQKLLFKTQLAVEIGGKRGISWLDNEIIDMKIGEQKTSYLTMPKEFINPPLDEDREIEARIKLYWLEEKEIPELTDEFLANNNIAKDMVELRGHVKVDLESQSRAIEDREAVERIQEWLLDNVKFTIPPQMVEEKKEEITERLRQEYQRHGEDIDILLKRVDQKGSDMRHEIDRLANEQARLDFIINDIAERESITVDQTDMINHIQIIAQQSNLKKHQVKKLMEDNVFLVSVYRSLLTRKVSNFLLNHSKREFLAEDEETESVSHPSEKPESEGGGLIVTG